MNYRPTRKAGFITALALVAGNLFLAATHAAEVATPAPLSSGIPDTGASFVRVMGALALVLGLFLGGVWLYRNWQRLSVKRGNAPKLNVMEVRSLGGKHALYVVGYEQQRFLLASSPTGVNMLSHLPAVEAKPEEVVETAAPVTFSFPLALAQVLGRK